ncbi:MAG: Hpt domain-containing protein [Saprospiraceae bacterium]
MFDLDHLSNLMGNDEQLVAKFLQLFREEVPVVLTELQKAIQAGDWDAVNIQAHTLKGQLGYLNAVELQSIALEIEMDAESGNTELIAQKAIDLIVGVVDLLNQLAV